MPVARIAGRASTSTGYMLLAVNVLNAADAVLTSVAVRSGKGAEANPVVDLIGLPAKIVLVGFASVWLSRTRPRLLILPILVLLAVTGYHLAGLRVSN